MEASKHQGEKALLEKREKIMLELEKLHQRVDDFNECGDMDMMVDYVADVRRVQKSLTEIQSEITWINKVSGADVHPVPKIICRNAMHSKVGHFIVGISGLSSHLHH